MVSDELDQFVENLLAEKNLPSMDDAVRIQLVADLKQRLLDQINRALIDALSDEKLNDFNAMLDDESITDERIEQFMAESGINVKQITLQTMLRFSELYLGRQGLRAEQA